MELNETGLRQLADGDLEWLMQQPRTLEREHVKAILDSWVGDVQHGRALEAENERLRWSLREVVDALVKGRIDDAKAKGRAALEVQPSQLEPK